MNVKTGIWCWVWEVGVFTPKQSSCMWKPVQLCDCPRPTDT